MRQVDLMNLTYPSCVRQNAEKDELCPLWDRATQEKLTPVINDCLPEGVEPEILEVNSEKNSTETVDFKAIIEARDCQAYVEQYRKAVAQSGDQGDCISVENGQVAMKDVSESCHENFSAAQVSSLKKVQAAALSTSIVAGTLNVVGCLSRVQSGEMSETEAVEAITRETVVTVCDSTAKAAAGERQSKLNLKKLPVIF